MKYRLGDIIEFNPKEKLSKGKKYKKISMEMLQPYKKYIENYTEEEYKGGSKFRNGDTLLARITPCLENGKTAQVNELEENEIGFGSTEFIVMRAKIERSDKDFIYYLSINKEFRNIAIKSMTGTSGRQRAQVDVLKDTIMDLPEYNEQVKIAKILSSIDKKIQLNNKINNNLYKLLEIMFRECFGNKKEDDNWEKIMLKDLISVRGGLAYKASLLSDNIDDNILVSMGNVELNTIFNFSNLKYYKENVENKYLGNVGDLFICTRDVTQKRNQLGCPGIIPKLFKDRKVIIGTNLYIVNILNSNENIKNFLYLLMNSSEYRERIIGSAKGTAVLMITKDDILNFEFYFPKDKKILDNFNNKVTPIFEKIENIIIENDRLSNLRNTLLPKLMNGEIDLDKIEI